ncbi:MAG: class II fumarate hydratase [Bacillota bacterium]|nr:class II fumarate hydratase [Bacillota bacterium]
MYREEHDTMGTLLVPENAYWGAQTQRSYENFKVGHEKMPMEIIRAFAIIKKASALTNGDLGLLDQERVDLIGKVCDEILAGDLDDHFPLVVWQTGSGTQSNMNVNEVIANRAKDLNKEISIHPNDHVNKSQSSNDTFPTAMHIAALLKIEDELLPALEIFRDQLLEKEKDYMDLVKIGRTHLQDATPLSLGQEISGWRSMIDNNIAMISQAKESLRQIALGGTAVGTGLNTHPLYGDKVAENISKLTGKNFVTASNKFHSLTSKDELVYVHGSLKALAANMMKIANDVRWLASGPRCGIGELIIPANEPGSSIMPGKVNPTQAESLTMLSVQVMANDVAVGMGASQGNFELNVFMPMIIYNFLQSVQLLADGARSFEEKCLRGLKANEEKIKENLNKSLMLVTALNTHIGYEKAAEIAKAAHAKGTSLKEAAIASGYLSEEDFDKWVKPEDMVHPHK